MKYPVLYCKIYLIKIIGPYACKYVRLETLTCFLGLCSYIFTLSNLLMKIVFHDLKK